MNKFLDGLAMIVVGAFTVLLAGLVGMLIAMAPHETQLSLLFVFVACVLATWAITRLRQ